MAWYAADSGRADPEAAAEFPAEDPAGPTATTDLPAAGPTAATGLPADGTGVDEHLHADVQHPALLCPGRVAECSEGNRRGADRGLRRDERLRGCTAAGQPLGGRIAAGSRLREAQQEPRDPLRADRPEDKRRFVRRGSSKRLLKAGTWKSRPLFLADARTGLKEQNTTEEEVGQCL